MAITTIKIISLLLKNSKDCALLQTLRHEYCHDKGFKKGYGCKRAVSVLDDDYIAIIEGYSDGYIFAIDTNTNEVCGLLEWAYLENGMHLRLISSKSYTTNIKYKGIGTRLMKKLFSLARKLGAHVFYFKMGFKHIAATGWFIKKIIQYSLLMNCGKLYIYQRLCI